MGTSWPVDTMAMEPKELLQSLMDLHKVSQAQLARDTGVGPGALNNHLSGRRSIGPQAAKAYSERFKVPIERFLFADEEASRVTP
jgi:transcriptional regulator with XRE-family HTH domain